MEFLFALVVKHAIADLGMQSHMGPRPKHKYFGSGHEHYLHHGFLTCLVSAFFFDLQTAALIGLIDYVAHWHIDFSKHHVNRIFKLQPKSTPWWWMNVLDQCLHFATYYGLAKLFLIIG